jgi:UDP-galactopyranose mutase
MMTFNKLWGVTTPLEAKEIIECQKYKGKVNNLEEQALALVGRDVYEKLIKGYTKKQWNKDPKDLPSSIIKRLPVRFTYDNNYFNDRFQGIPIGGYTQIFEKLLKGIKVRTNTDFFDMDKSHYDKIIYTGPIDKYFGFCCGRLEYRSLKWNHHHFNEGNVQGIAMLNRGDADVEFTRTIEHKHFDDNTAPSDFSIVTEEYPANYQEGVNEPLYPVNDDINNNTYRKYKNLAQKEDKKTHFGGRLARYKYYDMHQVIASALNDFSKLELDGDVKIAFQL